MTHSLLKDNSQHLCPLPMLIGLAESSSIASSSHYYFIRKTFNLLPFRMTPIPSHNQITNCCKAVAILETMMYF